MMMRSPGGRGVRRAPPGPARCVWLRLLLPAGLERSYSRLQYDDTRFAQNELERNRITRAHTNVSNLSFSGDPKKRTPSNLRPPPPNATRSIQSHVGARHSSSSSLTSDTRSGNSCCISHIVSTRENNIYHYLPILCILSHAALHRVMQLPIELK